MTEEKFSYSYSAKQQAEIKRIREKYAPSAENMDRMEQLRRLDASATRPGAVIASVTGALSTLLFGLGMCCTLVWADTMFVTGVVIGVVGIIGVAAAPLLYSRITRKRRKKLAPEIIRLSDELLDSQ